MPQGSGERWKSRSVDFLPIKELLKKSFRRNSRRSWDWRGMAAVWNVVTVYRYDVGKIITKEANQEDRAEADPEKVCVKEWRGGLIGERRKVCLPFPFLSQDI